MAEFDRRRFVTSASGLAAVTALLPTTADASERRRGINPETFPQQDPELVRGVVGASHANFDRVKELVEGYPELAKANWDWGFGDWESALGAASHTGRRQIALFLIENGARPTLFSAAMLGQIDVVRSTIEASPGVQRIPGPHGIPLLAHAAAGREEAADVHAYLTDLGDAGIRPDNQTLSEEARTGLLGRYRYGAGEGDVLVVTERDGGALYLARGEGTARGLSHQGDRSFSPAGAPSVEVGFAGPTVADSVVVRFGAETVTGRREP